MLFVMPIATIFFKAIFASPAPATSKNATSDFFSQNLPSSSFAFIDVGGMLPGEGDINGQVTNNCPFPVYVRQGVAERSGVTGEKCAGFVKISRNIGDTRVYQVEYSVDRRNNRIWYNLSTEDGAPF
ncbi:uncharacterized protein M421DRAFT_4617 [Didymella exigua CBS 183.55]|uniref:Uncharacterized protein n=1 Tax=Didymella exigua CBS 183.55 TaxID=1150837 RepID=A0A6A5RT26_9PLEO|nr:uncharacterized protein M421DRAFT_4617 [Didymella exigua CBS 183.55]KAF1929486.1 hypothetical protein M421DRAFT_4617 [Didymella exigua CBS 183.55]